MNNKYFVIILTCIVFLVVCFIGVKELFSVSDITVRYSVVNESNVENVADILEKYKGKCLLFVDTEKIKEEITADRYLKVTEVKKIYPCEISVTLQERTESFYYVEEKDGASVYCYFDNEFFVVKKNNTAPKSEKGLMRIGFVDKFNGKMPELRLKNTVKFDYGFNDMITEIISALGDSKNNFTSITFVGMNEEGNYRLLLQSVEGVSMEIRRADKDLTEKILCGLQCYKGLSESERIANSIVVYNTSDKIVCDYTKNSGILL